MLTEIWDLVENSKLNKSVSSDLIAFYKSGCIHNHIIGTGDVTLDNAGAVLSRLLYPMLMPGADHYVIIFYTNSHEPKFIFVLYCPVIRVIVTRMIGG